VGRELRRSEPTLTPVNGVDLCVQTFGAVDDPPLLLIGGSESSMDWWEEEFCELLAAGPRFVIRYDHRDTGGSVTYPPGAPGYDGNDLSADALGVLDALGIARAHLVGVSMGAGIAQELALEQPERVETLSLISTTSVGVRAPGRPALPSVSAELAARFAAPPPEPDWSDRDAVVDYVVEGLGAYAGSVSASEERRRELVELVVDRSLDMASTMQNHSAMDQGEPVRGRVHDLRVPTLVLHGTEDPLFPFPHGEALADEIPGARLVPLEGVGHELPPRPLWPLVVEEILGHTRPSRQAR
jgi:pimeloyl-ACP methyl ester carboxylesterase